MRVDCSAGTGMSVMDKFGGIIDRMNMKLGSKFLNSLRNKTYLLERLQRAIVVDGVTHSQKDNVQGRRGSLKGGAEALMLFLCDAQLVLRSSVLTVLDLDEVNVTFALENAKIFGSGGAVWSRWICWWRLAMLLKCSHSPSVDPCHS